MPKFPLFQDEPLYLVACLRAMFSQPEKGNNMALINELLDLHADPLKSMSWEMITLVSETCCFNNAMRCVLYGCVGKQDLRGAGGRIAREVNRWVLVNAEAAGFLPAPRPFPNQFDLRLAPVPISTGGSGNP